MENMMANALAGLNISYHKNRTNRTNPDAASKKKSISADRADREFEATRYYTAKKHYTNAILLNQESSRLYARRAECHLILAEFDSASSDAMHACLLEPNCGAAISCLLQLGEIAKLERIYSALDERLIRCCTKYTSFLQLKQFDREIVRFSEEKQFEECIRKIELVMLIANKCRKYQQIHVECLIMLFNYDEAAKSIDKYFKKIQDQGIKHFLLGLMYFIQDDLEASMKEFNESQKAHPGFEKASQFENASKNLFNSYCRGLENYKNGDFSTAKQFFMTAVSIFPGKTENKKVLLYNLASANIELQEFQYALDHLNDALRLDEKYLKALEKRAEVHFQLKEFEDSIVDLKEIMSLVPSEIVRIKIEKTKDALSKIEKDERPTSYQILGISNDKSNLTRKSIDSAFRKMTKLCHSDKFHSATKLEKKKWDRKMCNITKARDDLIKLL